MLSKFLLDQGRVLWQKTFSGYFPYVANVIYKSHVGQISAAEF